MDFETTLENGYIVAKTTIKNEYGIHARPASRITKKASVYPKDIYLTYPKNTSSPTDADEERYDCKSITSLLTMCADRGANLRVHVQGEDEAAISMCKFLADYLTKDLEQD